MLKQFSVSYGRNYKVVLAIVLPCLLIVPFIFLMQALKFLEEWKIWVIIFSFLGGIIALALWLVFRVYPSAILSINKNEISLSFKQTSFLSPSDFSFCISDIISFTSNETGGDVYFLFKTQKPFRKFQVSSSSNSIEDVISFNEVMVEISEMINNANNGQ